MNKAVGGHPGLLAEEFRFIREQDEFVHEQDLPSQVDKRKLYQLSEKKVDEFQETLKQFHETLEKRKVFSRLKIPAKDPADFDIDYVLSIAVRLSEWNHKSDEINICRRFARQFCQETVKNKNILWGLIKLAPTDIYGSLVSGGFTIILAVFSADSSTKAMEAHEKLRNGMEQSLARIPKELSKIRRLSNVYIQRDELHRRAAEVLVSIFTVLERIIEKISRSWTENISMKFRDDGGTVQGALQSLSDSIAEFNEEAEVCAQLRMGRIEETGLAIKSTVESTRDVVDGTSTKVTDIQSKLKELCDNQTILLGDRAHVVRIMNQIYSFMASNPAFNAADGTVDRKYLTPAEANNDGKRSTELVERWFSSLGEFNPSPENDIKKLIEYSETLTLKEQDKVAYIMGCQSFQDWLGKPRSSALCVRAETAPGETINFMSVSAAMLALTLGGATGFITLSFFCSLQKRSSPLDGDSGALGVVKSLNGQLLKIMLKRKLLVDQPFDQNDRIWTKSTDNLKYSCGLLKKLIAGLRPGSVVFVLLDSVSRTSGDKSMVDNLAERILRIGRQSPSILLKLLVTDPVPSSHFRRTADLSLHVPDDVDGWQCGMNVESIKGENALKLRDLEELQEGV